MMLLAFSHAVVSARHQRALPVCPSPSDPSNPCLLLKGGGWKIVLINRSFVLVFW